MPNAASFSGLSILPMSVKHTAAKAHYGFTFGTFVLTFELNSEKPPHIIMLFGQGVTYIKGIKTYGA
jgi:hypothetical protein